MAKVLATRLEAHLPSLIHPAQVGFIKGVVVISVNKWEDVLVFPLYRGTTTRLYRGYPLSPLIFALALEPKQERTQNAVICR